MGGLGDGRPRTLEHDLGTDQGPDPRLARRLVEPGGSVDSIAVDQGYRR